MEKESIKKRICKVGAIFAAGAALLAGYALFVRFTGFGIPCIFNRYFRIKCPACGLSRAAACIIAFDFSGAFELNLIWPLYLIYGIWVFSSAAFRYIKYGERLALPNPIWVNYAVWIAMLVYGVVRNFLI